MFKVGQRVVCIKSHSQGFVKKGEEYEIKAIDRCSCDATLLDVGKNTESSHLICSCGKCLLSNGVLWVGSILFKPIEYDIISNKDLIKEIITERLDIPIKKPVLI